MPIHKTWDILSKVNRHSRDNRIVFEEETHTYRIDGNTQGWKSVTTLLSQFHEPFEPEKVAKTLMNGMRFKSGGHPLSGKSLEDILKFWKLENQRGTALHARMERAMNERFHLQLRSSRHSSGEIAFRPVECQFLNQDTLLPTDTHAVLMGDRNGKVYEYIRSNDALENIPGKFLGYCWADKTVRRNMEEDAELGVEEPVLGYEEAIQETNQVEAFWNDYSFMKPYRSEWVIWDAEWKLAGTIDALFEDTRDGSYWIFDWKRVRNGLEADLEATRWGYEQEMDEWLEPVRPWVKKMPEPFHEVYSTKYWHYSLQLNLYRKILEQNYGIRIKGMILVQLHPELGDTGQYHRVVFMDAPLNNLLENTVE
jgi:hypothetical protein